MEIIAGEIRISQIDVVLDEPYAKVWHVDLASKYAEVLVYSTDEVLLMAGERTLRIDQSLAGTPTVLKVGLGDDWLVMVECVRYTCRVVGYLLRAGVPG